MDWDRLCCIHTWPGRADRLHFIDAGICPMVRHEGPCSPAETSQTRSSDSFSSVKCCSQASFIFSTVSSSNWSNGTNSLAPTCKYFCAFPENCCTKALHNNFPGCWNTCFFCCLSLCASLLLNLFLELLPRSISHVYRSMHVHTPLPILVYCGNARLSKFFSYIHY